VEATRGSVSVRVANIMRGCPLTCAWPTMGTQSRDYTDSDVDN